MGEACGGECCDRGGETKALFGYWREERSVVVKFTIVLQSGWYIRARE